MSSFETFLDAWLVRQEYYLNELLSAQHHCHESSDDDLKDLINRVISHYEQYYAEKSRAAHCDIYLMFSPIWFTTLESTMLWVAGFKPGLVPRLVLNSITDLSEDQSRRVNRLIHETRMAEKMINDEFAMIQESVAAPPVLEAARRIGRVVDVEVREEEVVLNSLKSRLESVLARADFLRTRTAMKAVEILSPTQNVKFLGEAAQFQLRIRSWGLQKDSERQE